MRRHKHPGNVWWTFQMAHTCIHDIKDYQDKCNYKINHFISLGCLVFCIGFVFWLFSQCFFLFFDFVHLVSYSVHVSVLRHRLFVCVDFLHLFLISALMYLDLVVVDRCCSFAHALLSLPARFHSCSQSPEFLTSIQHLSCPVLFSMCYCCTFSYFDIKIPLWSSPAAACILVQLLIHATWQKQI